MLNLYREILANTPHAVALALALGVVIGLVGSAIEAVGMFMQRFANVHAQATGIALEHFGKLLEAYATDVPKIVTNVAALVGRFAKLFGPTPLALLALGSLVLATSVSACGAAQTKSEAQNAAIVAGCYASEDLAKGEAGAPDELTDLAKIKQGCATALRVWERAP